MKRRITTTIGAFAIVAMLACSGMAPVQVQAAKNATQQSGTEDTLSGSVNGVSKVIGIEGRGVADILRLDDRNTVPYYYVNRSVSRNVQVVSGNVKNSCKDAATGLYVYNGLTYGDVSYSRTRNITTFRKAVIKVLGQAAPASSFDADSVRTNGYYAVDGVYYASCECRKNYDAESKQIGETYYLADTSSPVVPAGDYATYAERDAAEKAMMRTANGGAVPEDYKGDIIYRVQDKFFYNGSSNMKLGRDTYRDANNTTHYILYAYVRDEIALADKAKTSYSWNALSAKENDMVNGKQIRIGYEVEVNGQKVNASNESDYYSSSDSYEIVKDGDAFVYVSRYNSCRDPKLLAAGESSQIRVRGVYYTETVQKDKVQLETDKEDYYYKGEKYNEYTYEVVKYGAWSDLYTYTRRIKKEVPQVGGLTAVLNGSVIKLTWEAVPEASSYSVYALHSKTPLPLSPDNFGLYYNKDEETLKAAGLTKDLYKSSIVNLNVRENTATISYQKNYSMYAGDYVYHYYAVKADSIRDTDNYVDNTTYSNIAAIQFAATAQVPAVKNLHIEKNTDGGFVVAWDETDIDANVVVYAYDEKTLPLYFNYTELNAKRAEPEMTKVYLDAQGNATDKLNAVEVKYEPITALTVTALGDARLFDSYTDTSFDETVKAGTILKVLDTNSSGAASQKTDAAGNVYYRVRFDGRSYYVLAAEVSAPETTPVMETKRLTEDMSADEKYLASKVKKQNTSLKSGQVSFGDLEVGKTYYFTAYTYSSVNANVEREPKQIGAYAYTQYNDISAPSKTVSKKITLGDPTVYASVTKSSVKLTMVAGNETGFEIYRMNKKGKYKKIATVTNDEYTDKELTLGEKYTYRVRSYYYDPDTKRKAYSDYNVVSAVPSNIKGIKLEITEPKKTSAKLKWTKVAKATKYEIYRCDTSNYDRKTYTRTELNKNKWELIKTIKKASSTSYTDKKLKAGKTYSYVIYAYYEEGKETGYISASNSVSTELSTPRNVIAKMSGSTAKISWAADKFATGYEVAYTMYDQYGVQTANIAKVVKTKKTSYSIKNVPNGGYVNVSVRGYDKSGMYSRAYTVNARKSLGVAKSIKASYSKGKKAVKISWKKVAGAKYYIVYRSTKSGIYISDEKKYLVAGSYISRQANDDESNDRVVYDEYLGIPGSVVGTTVYDFAQLDDKVTYYYSVVAYGEAGTDIKSVVSTGIWRGNIASGKQAAYVASVGKKLTISSIKNSKKGQAVIRFNKVSGAAKYTILRATKKNGKYEEIGTTKKNSFTDKKAKKGTTYYYKVVATGKDALKADFKMTSAAKKIKIKK